MTNRTGGTSFHWNIGITAGESTKPSDSRLIKALLGVINQQMPGESAERPWERSGTLSTQRPAILFIPHNKIHCIWRMSDIKRCADPGRPLLDSPNRFLFMQHKPSTLKQPDACYRQHTPSSLCLFFWCLLMRTCQLTRQFFLEKWEHSEIFKLCSIRATSRRGSESLGAQQQSGCWSALKRETEATLRAHELCILQYEASLKCAIAISRALRQTIKSWLSTVVHKHGNITCMKCPKTYSTVS